MRIVILLLAAGLSLAAVAAGSTGNQPAPPGPTNADPLLVVPESGPAGKSEEECPWGCAKWGRQCNVDVRGVRRCQNVCEKFDRLCQ
jgi:hypothetical protein